MLVLEKNSKKIITDSGGIQKEAYFFKVPCITVRKNTEWVETVDDGWNVLVEADKRKMVEKINKFNPTSRQRNVYGGGKASNSISKILGEIE